MNRASLPAEPPRPIDRYLSLAALGGGALALLWVGVATLFMPYAQLQSELTSLPGLIAWASVMALVITAFLVRPRT